MPSLDVANKVPDSEIHKPTNLPPVSHPVKRAGQAAVSLLSGALSLFSLPGCNEAGIAVERPQPATRKSTSLPEGAGSNLLPPKDMRQDRVDSVIESGMLIVNLRADLSFLAALDAPLRLGVANKLLGSLNSTRVPRDPKGAVSWKEVLDHERRLHLLSVVAPDAYNEVIPAADKYLADLISSIGNPNTPTSHDFIELDRRIRELYKLSHVATRQREERYLELINRLDHVLQKADLAEVRTFIKETRIKWQSGAESAMQRGSNELKELDQTSPLYVRLCGSAFYTRDSVWYYKPQLEKDQGEWRLELHRKETTADRSILALRKLNDPRVFIAVRQRRLMQLMDDDKVDTLVRMAEKTRAQELEHAALIKSYDLPRDRRIIYLRIFSKDEDEVIRSSLMACMLMRYALAHRYGAAMEVQPIIFTDELIPALTEAFKKPTTDPNQKVHFHIEFYCHGDDQSLHFRDDPTGADLVKAVFSNPNVTASISTMACYGGGLREAILREMRDKPYLKQLLVVFLQTKPNMVNEVALLSDWNTTKIEHFGTLPADESLYYLLNSNCPIGEVFQKAGDQVEESSYTDPEAIVDGELISDASQGSLPWTTNSFQDPHQVQR